MTDQPPSDALAQTRRNLRLTRIVVVLAFAANAGANFALIGYFARLGGLELVGQWALLGAIILNVMILDLGSVNALTYKIARDGVEAAAPSIRRLICLAMRAAILPIALGVAALWAHAPLLLGASLAALAALLQLSSNWLIAIRMGRQQQYWFNAKTILRVLVQAAAAVIGISVVDAAPIVILGLALLFGGMAEFALASILVRGEHVATGSLAALKDLRKLTAGFGITDVAQRSYQPLTQLLVANTLGASALGVFTVGLRIPVVVNQSLNEALRILLPSLARILAQGDRSTAIRLIRDSVVIQLVLVVPAGVFLFCHAGPIIALWLGDSGAQIVIAVRVFSAALIFVAIGTPFHWVAQAEGNAQRLGTLGLVVMVVMLISAASAVAIGANVIACTVIYALGQTARAMGAIAISKSFLGEIIQSIRWPAIILHVFAAIVVNIIVIAVTRDQTASTALFIAIASNALLIAPLSYLIVSRKWV